MKITILCSDASHPVNAWLKRWRDGKRDAHEVEIVRSKHDAPGGNLLFLISCSEIVNARDRAKYQKSLVLHASDLPRGRGWSPHIWQIIGGAHEITLTLLEAEDKVDSGRIWKQMSIAIPAGWLFDEINEALFDAELALMDYAVESFSCALPAEQNPSIAPTYYRKRTPEDSRIDPNRSIAEQFDQIRVCDPARFPAFFELHGNKYRIIVERCSDE